MEVHSVEHVGSNRLFENWIKPQRGGDELALLLCSHWTDTAMCLRRCCERELGMLHNSDRTEGRGRQKPKTLICADGMGQWQTPRKQTFYEWSTIRTHENKAVVYITSRRHEAWKAVNPTGTPVKRYVPTDCSSRMDRPEMSSCNAVEIYLGPGPILMCWRAFRPKDN